MRAKARGTAAAAMMVIAAFCLLAAAPASAATRPGFSVKPALLQPGFKWKAKDYALRSCEADPRPEISVRGADGWLASVGGGKFQAGDYSTAVGVATGESTTVSFKREGHGHERSFYVRCLPDDFPGYSFERTRKGGPRMWSMQMGARYAAIFTRDGAPIWWYQASGEPDNMAVMEDGTISYAPVDQASLQVGDYEVRSLRGKLLRHFGGAGNTVADIHDLRLLPNGNYMIGSQFTFPADTSAYGGSADSRVIGIEIQELSPDGDLVWSWSSRDQIGLEETGRWWDLPFLDDEPYDASHWNSVDVDGRRILLSFRHLDAVYEIDKKTGEIVWKLGGTPTPQSLEVLGDPHADQPLGGQHDARFYGDDEITIHDNRTALGDPPRLLRYKIDEQAGTATLLESVSDPDVPDSFCCGSARKLGSGGWLAGWGGNSVVGAYDKLGRRIFKFSLDVGFSYRSNPVPKGSVKPKQLRKAMDAMSAIG